MGRNETLVVKWVFWLVQVLLRDKYRLFSSKDLKVVIEDYLAEMQNLGMSFVYTKAGHPGQPTLEVSTDDYINSDVSASEAESNVVVGSDGRETPDRSGVR